MLLREVRQLVDDLKYPLDFEDQDWSQYPNASCYGYALGLPIDRGFLVGDFIGDRKTHGDSVSDIIATLKKELEMLGFWVFDAEVDDYVEDNCLKIYVEFDRCNNYHFLRENSDGTWSHKAARQLPKQTDLSGSYILDPESLSKALGTKARYCFIICNTNYA